MRICRKACSGLSDSVDMSNRQKSVGREFYGTCRGVVQASHAGDTGIYPSELRVYRPLEGLESST